MDTPGIDATGFVLRLGRAFHTAGYSADRVEQVMQHASRRLGLEGQFFAMPTSIMAGFGPLERQSTHLMRVQPGAVNLARMAALDVVVRDVERARTTPGEGSARVEAVLATPRPWPKAVTALAYAVASATGCRFLGGGAAEIAVALVVGLLLGSLAVGFASRTGRVEPFEFVGGLVGAAVVASLAAAGYRCAISTTTLGGLVTLLPGLTLTVAMTELASRHLAAGTARLAGSVVGLIALVVGVAVGTTLVTALSGPVRSVRIVALPAWTRYVALGVAPFAFGVLLGARPRDLPWILLAALLGFWGLQLGQRTLGGEPGASMGALVIGLSANFFERVRLGPAATIMVPGILLLVPGSLGFSSVTALLDENVVAGVDAWSKMLLTAVSLASGLLLANVVLPPRRGE